MYNRSGFSFYGLFFALCAAYEPVVKPVMPVGT